MKHRVNFLFGILMSLLFLFVMGNAHGSPTNPKPVNHCVNATGKANGKVLKHSNPKHYRLLKRNHKRNSRHVRYQTPRASKTHTANFHGTYACNTNCPPKFR